MEAQLALENRSVVRQIVYLALVFIALLTFVGLLASEHL